MTLEYDDGYKKLYAAIYGQAVVDDTREVRKRIHDALVTRKVSADKIYHYLAEKKNEIEGQVKIDIYREALDWPGTKKEQMENISRLVGRLVDEF